MKVFCPPMDHFEANAKANRGLMNSGIIGLASGAVLGHLFEMRVINLNLSYSSWNKTAPAITAIRIVISALIYAIFGAPYFFVSIDVD